MNSNAIPKKKDQNDYKGKLSEARIELAIARHKTILQKFITIKEKKKKQ